MQLAIDRVELLPAGPVQIRWLRTTVSEGETQELGYHREARVPGDSVADLPADVQATIAQHWTLERVAAWNAAEAAFDEQ